MKKLTGLTICIVILFTLFSFTVMAEGNFGGTLKVGITSDLDSLNPIISNDRIGSWLLNNVYPTLYLMNEDAVKIPYVAEEINTSKDGMTVTVKLAEGLEWEDGEPFTVEDIYYSGKVLQDQGLKYGNIFENVEKIDMPDDYTIIYHLKQPFPAFMGKFGFWCRIAPEHIFSDYDNLKTFPNKKPVGLGPFVITQYKKGQYYIMESVDEWPLAEQGRPYLDKIIWRIYPDVNTMVLALKSGEIDLTAKDIPHMAAQELEKDSEFTVVQNESLGYVYMGFNFRNKYLKNKELREAIANAVDRQKIIDIALEGDGSLIDTPVSPVYPEILNPDVKLPNYNVENAREILSNAGYEDTDDNGFINDPETGEDVSLEITYDGHDIYLRKTVQILTANLNEIGISISLKPLEKATYINLVFNENDFDINVGGWGIIDPLNDSLYALFYSENYLNFMGMDSPEIDQYTKDIRYATTKQEQIDAVYKFQKKMNEIKPVVPLYVQNYNFAYSNDFAGFTVYPSDLKGLVDPQSLVNVYKK